MRKLEDALVRDMSVSQSRRDCQGERARQTLDGAQRSTWRFGSADVLYVCNCQQKALDTGAKRRDQVPRSKKHQIHSQQVRYNNGKDG